MPRELHVHTHPTHAEHWRHVVEIVALSIAALWAFYVFIYQEKIKPATAPPKLQPTVTVDRTILHSGKEFVKISIEMKNIGESDVDLGAIVANVYGIKFGSSAGKQSTTPIPGIEKVNFALETSQQKPLYSFYDTWRAVGSPKPHNIPIAPGESWTESFAVGIRPGEYDVAAMMLEYCFAHPTAYVWHGRKSVQADGTLWLDFPDGDSPQCLWQRNGLYYPL